MAKPASNPGELYKLGPYTLVRKLGAGGMGAVFLAEDALAGRQVAIKVLSSRLAKDKEFLERFKREAIATGRLNHPNIVSANTVGEDRGIHYFVMEYCAGSPLDSKLNKEKQFDFDLALDITKQIAAGLKYAHDHNLIHRDIKPANVIYTTEGVAKILDLGLSKKVEESGVHGGDTAEGMALGTPHFISPEQARGEHLIDGRADIYCLGGTLYNFITGRTPFDDPNPAVVMTKHVMEEPVSPTKIRPDTPPNIERLIKKMMAKLPAARHANCGELISEIEKIQRERAGHSSAKPTVSAPYVGSRDAGEEDEHENIGTRGHGKTGRRKRRVIARGISLLPFVAIIFLVVGVAVLEHLGYIHFGSSSTPAVVKTNETPTEENLTPPVAPKTASPKEEVKAVVETKKVETPATHAVPPPTKHSPWETVLVEDFEKIDLNKLPPDRGLGNRPVSLSLVKDGEHGNVLKVSNPNVDSYGIQFVLNLDPKTYQGKTIRISSIGKFPGAFTPMPGKMNMSPRMTLEMQQVIGNNLFPFARLEPNTPGWQHLTLVRSIPLLTKSLRVGVGNHFAAAETYFDDVKVEVLKGGGEFVLNQDFNTFDLNKLPKGWELNDKNIEGKFAIEPDPARGKVLTLTQSKVGGSVSMDYVCDHKALAGHVVFLSAAIKMNNAFPPVPGKLWACPRIMLYGKRTGRDYYGGIVEVKSPQPEWMVMKEVATIPEDLDALMVSIRIDEALATYSIDEVKLEVLPN